jgi:chromosome segregation protein
MLKRLELVGFKSFADKTPFDFASGITAVVGPNGSGKSNVVDAVRWILGEQSAKSLRGGEMADVIFNGSATRRGFGMAEVTMTFDNAGRHLSTDSAEVQITRRVYRSGEGEYLINQQPCRLKDIKDLFLGSGAGSNAYSIIEQGRVDVLLQASTKDRRVIFEEAAGISRFKARKIETLRKLERVDLNLQRLRDILDEVDKQLRSVKLQASKAQRYQEYSQRLRELRLALGLHDYHFLSGKLESEQEVLDRLRSGLNKQSAETEAGEGSARRLDEALAGLEEALHAQETKQAEARQRIAAEETTLGREAALSADLEADVAQGRARLTEATSRVAELTAVAEAAARECAGVDSECQEHRGKVRAIEDELQVAVVRLAQLQRQLQADKAEHFEQMRRAGHLRNDAITCKAQMDNLARELEKIRAKGAQAEEHLASLDIELQALTDADSKLQTRLAAARHNLAEQTQERERLRSRAEEAAALIADLKAERSGLASRIDVLAGLERSHEGLGAGIREVFGLLEQGVEKGSGVVSAGTTPVAAQAGTAETTPDPFSTPNPWTADLVLGMVADFLTVKREYAPLIDLALGETAQRFLVRDMSRLNEALRQRAQPFSSRVSFLPISASQAPIVKPQAADEVGTLGVLAVQVVTCEHPELAGLPAQLLGQTRIVPDLATARGLAAETPGLRFVTLQGELLEADGTLTVGTYHPEAGILSRKSELRELRGQAVVLDSRIADTEREASDLRSRASTLENQLAAWQEEIAALADQAADLRTRIGQHQERRAGLHEEVTLSRSEMSGIQEEITSLDAAFRRAQELAEEADRQVQALQQRMEQADVEIRSRDAQRQLQQQDYTAAKVALATVEERLSALRAQQRQAEADLAQRRQERLQGEQQVAASLSRLQESQRAMLQASAALAICYLDKESAERQVAQHTSEREGLRRERQSLGERLQAAQGAWRRLQEEAHTCELQASDLQHRRNTLADRLREDYQLDLEQLYQERKASETGAAALTLSQDDLTKTNEEIDDLRRKLSRLGSVNMDALQELTELEGRATALQTQCDDLTAAQKALQEIIAKINQDSRKLFADCFQAIRTHFQELFRKLFGGGMADIVLEDENDILESGIEIIARPPGKELRSISLMSGGEKTLTAVALLLAIFRSKPSPFCILDEVDAALDEANIGRFTAVLREFLDRSQFILITHSKKTMACADVLYGITMQESGISKRVAVRFEDWPSENGNGEVNGNGHASTGSPEQEPGFAGR